MNYKNLILPTAALGLGTLLLVPAQDAGAFTTIGGDLSQSQRDFRTFNNFTDSQANNNTAADDQFPGYTGAVMAIWKASVEWGSEIHGDGTGDPHQNGSLGSGGGNFDASFQGEANSIGSTNENVHSELSGGSGGVLAFTETPISNGWRIRYYESWTWQDGPTTNIGGGIDLQGVACHEYGHALGLGHTSVSGSTMLASITGSGVAQRSIGSDDSAGVQSIYGVASSNKPHISDIVIVGTTLTVNGSNFAGSSNQVWFTQSGSGGSGVPIKVTNLASNGSSITCSIPSNAGPGDIMVRNNQTGHNDLSNAFPTDVQPNGGCVDPIPFCATSTNSVGNGALFDYSGSTSLAANNLTVACFGLPPNQFGIFFYGSAESASLFGEGVLCVAGGSSGIVRTPPIQADFVGDVTMNVNYNLAPFGSGPGTWTVNSEWYMQFWYRDPAGGGSNFNLSNGLKFTVCPLGERTVARVVR